MNFVKTTIATAAALAAFSLPTFAQDAEFKLPAQCLSAHDMSKMDHAAMGHAGAMGDAAMADDLSTAPAHVQENMRKMMITMPAMEQGMRMEDPDVAFACGMIAHHQGAIDMARVLLDHGDDPVMMKLAKEIMDAQVGEIAQMTEWLAANAK